MDIRHLNYKITSSLDEIRKLAKNNLPTRRKNEKKIYLFVRDITHHIDYYIMAYDPFEDTIFSLVDPHFYNNVLELGEDYITELEDATLFYVLLDKNRRLSWRYYYNQILPFKFKDIK